nr:retrovirus-related Pol polyprotein from transposon TNT 1-94 [Tanacetum cinerariifolium]
NFHRYKALMNELVNDDTKLSKLEINTGFLNGLPKKWLSFCQSLRNTNNVKDSKIASLFDCWSKTSVPSYQSTFQPKPLSFSQHKPDLRPTKDFEAKYNKIKAKLALLSSSTSDSKAATTKNKGRIAEACKWDEEEVSSDDNEMVEVKVLMALAEDDDVVSKEGARNGE